MAISETGMSSSNPLGGEYQVFLSFRGPDTRRGFTNTLYHALLDVGIRVFIDDEELRPGEKISGNFLRAIDHSKLYIPIFSPNYASSHWCLRELAIMVENISISKEDGNEKVMLPIFYGVKPDDVELKTELYSKAILELEQKKKFSKHEVEKWRQTLKELGAIKGWEVENYQGDGDLCRSVVEEVVIRLQTRKRKVTQDLVGMEDQLAATKNFLDIDSGDVRLLGICGMGGIGKTTLAKIIFNQLCPLFGKNCSFLDDVRETAKTKGLVKLQEQLLSDISNPRVASNIFKSDYGIKAIEENMCNKKVLIVLDDVDDGSQIKELIGINFLYPGTRILVTARDNRVLNIKGFKYEVLILTYEMVGLSEKDALQLFSRHAFYDNSPPSDYYTLSKEIVSSMDGLPLALEAIGSLLFGQIDKRIWEEVLEKLKKTPHGDVLGKLRMTYDTLKPGEQQIFLDVACFFIGCNTTDPIYMWKVCGFKPKYAIDVLIKRCMIKILDNDNFWMHDQFRDLGRAIASEKRSWLRARGNILRELRLTEINKSVQASMSGDPLLKKLWRSIMGNIRSKPKSTEQRRSHRIRTRTSFLSQALDSDSAMVSGTFEPPHQAEELDICSVDIESSPPEYSRTVLMCKGLGLTEPPEVTKWQSFTEIHLMENQLTELSENPRCPALSVLFLNRNCKLRTISPSFFDYMPALETLDLSQTTIKSLPESLFRLSHLKKLFLNHCELLRVLPPEIGELQQLEVLDLEGTEIMDLPKEVAKLTKLTCLKVSFCPRTNYGKESAKANALISQGTISSLSQLEELSINIHPEDEGWESVVEAIVDDVCGLMRLDRLKLYFPQVEHLRKWFGTSNVPRSLSHFNFIVGKDAERIMCHLPEELEFELERWDRSLKYVNGVGVPIAIQKMLQHTIAFFLDRHRDVTKLSDFGIENIQQLKCCIIGECNEIQVIVDGTDLYDEADRSEIVLETWENDRRFLGSLEYLYIYRMKSLRCIYMGPLHQGCLSHLKCLALLTCPQLTTVFTPGLLENLDSLEELNVEDCPLVSSLVSCEDISINESTDFLPKLKKLSLVSLPKLIRISNGLRIAPNLEQRSIIDCPNLKESIS